MWDVYRVLEWFRSWADIDSFYLRQLSSKLTTLLCLLSFCRVSDVRAFDHSTITFSPDEVTFHISRRTKTLSTPVSYPFFSAEPSLCIVCCVQSYLHRSATFLSLHLPQLLLSYVCSHRPVSSPSLARWILWIWQAWIPLLALPHPWPFPWSVHYRHYSFSRLVAQILFSYLLLSPAPS